MTNRGCPYACIYCTASITTGKKFRFRDAENVVAEIKEIVHIHGINFISFYADTFTLKKEFVMDLCKRIGEEGLKFQWACNSRVDTVDEEMLMAMKKAGCRYIFFGAESGSQEILKTSKKGITVEQTRTAVATAKKHGIEVVCYFIFGLPGETMETARKTLDLALTMDPDYAYFSMATPYPGTEYWEIAQRDNLIVNGNLSSDQLSAIVRTKDLSPEQINSIMQEAYRKFYFRPKKVANEAVKIVAKKQWYEIVKGLQMAKWVVETNIKSKFASDSA